MSNEFERHMQDVYKELIRWQRFGKEKIAVEINQFFGVLQPEMVLDKSTSSGRIDLSTLALPAFSPKREIISALSEQNDKGEVTLCFQFPKYSDKSCLYVANKVTDARIHICGESNSGTEFVAIENVPLSRLIPTRYNPYEKFITARRLIDFLQRDFQVDALPESRSASSL